MALDVDTELRASAFAFLDGVRGRGGGLVTRAELETFRLGDRTVRLIAPRQGIWKPAWLECALSVVTTFTPPNRPPPYEDDIGEDGYPRYKWRGVDPSAFDNVALRRAMELGKPLIWFIGVAAGLYDPVFPVWLVGEEPAEHQFVMALDETVRREWRPLLSEASEFDPTRRYAEALVRVRLHQRVFRDRVLLAYESQCALCRLRHPVLLDAAHIKEDSEGGEPIVPNGMAMCAIHHRAFDANVLGVRPDYKVEIRRDVLVEADGPTLKRAPGLARRGDRAAAPASRTSQPRLARGALQAVRRRLGRVASQRLLGSLLTVEP